LNSTDPKQISVAEIARLYGGEMTYNAVENYLRRFRKDAKAIKEAATDRESPAPSPARPRTKKAETSPTKAGEFFVICSSEIVLMCRL
jgi:hypothetical protein